MKKNKHMPEFISGNHCEPSEETIQSISDELTSIIDLCKKSGYTAEEIEKTAKPFYQRIKASNKTLWLHRIAKVGIIIVFLMICAHVGPIQRLYSTCSRRLLIAAIPHWDWTPMFDWRCLVDNPSYKGFVLTDKDCELCEGLGVLRRVKNTTMKEISEKFLKRDIPVIIEDGVRDWGDLGNINTNKLAKIFLKHPILSRYRSCEFVSNMRTKHRSDHRAFLRRITQEDISEYYAHWENCEKEAAKALREYIKRPYFLPPMVQLSNTNWVYVSSRFQGKKPKVIAIYHQMNMIIQLKGEIDILVQPRGVCEDVCELLTDTLKEGEILLTTDIIWDLKYFPGIVEESIGIGTGGRFD